MVSVLIYNQCVLLVCDAGILFLLQFLTTPYVCATRNPRWETAVEFFVADFTQVLVIYILCVRFFGDKCGSGIQCKAIII